MSAINNNLIEAPLPQTTVFESSDLTSKILEFTQTKTPVGINRAFKVECDHLINASWKFICSRMNADKSQFQKDHPTLSSFICSWRIRNFTELVSHLRKEAEDLNITGHPIYAQFRESIAPKDVLALDALIEETNYIRANRDNYLMHIFEDIEIPEDSNYKTWNRLARLSHLSRGRVRYERTIELNNIDITRIPAGIFSLKALQSLDLSNNRLKILPVEMEKLKKLRHLNLRYNKFPTLPPEIDFLENLQTLNLNITQLYPNPDTISSLIALNQRGCHITPLHSINVKQFLYVSKVIILGILCTLLIHKYF